MKLKFLAAAGLALAASSVMAAEFTVQMKNVGADGTMVFEPAVVKAAVGDTVHFVPTDMGHNVETVAGLVPDGAAGWKGAIGQKVSVTLDKEGVYVYQCTPHAIMAMVGVVVAGQPANLDAVQANASSLTSKFVMNKDRLDKYLAQAK